MSAKKYWVHVFIDSRFPEPIESFPSWESAKEFGENNYEHYVWFIEETE